jgi:hypothetical protein
MTLSVNGYYKSNTTGAILGAGNAYLSGATEFALGCFICTSGDSGDNFVK